MYTRAVLPLDFCQSAAGSSEHILHLLLSLAQCCLKQGGPSMIKIISSMGNLSIILTPSHLPVLWIGFDSNDSLDPTCLNISLWSHAYCCSQFLSLVYCLLNILAKIINFSAFTQNGQQPSTFQDIQRVNWNCIKLQVELDLSLPQPWIGQDFPSAKHCIKMDHLHNFKSQS